MAYHNNNNSTNHHNQRCPSTPTPTSTTTHRHHHPHHNHYNNNNNTTSLQCTQVAQARTSVSRISPSSTATTATSRRSSGKKGAAYLILLLCVLHSVVVPGGALCEDRCERVVPMLSHLRALWSRSFKRVGEKRVSFEEFMVSLVQASSNTGHSRAYRLGNALLGLMGQYQDCVMACEHPFSKRAAVTARSAPLPPLVQQQQQTRQRQRQRYTTNTKAALSHWCDRIRGSSSSRRDANTFLLEQLCLAYLHP